MSEIIVLKQPPVVFTKDKDWGKYIKLKPGAIIVLPEDAVLFDPPEEGEQDG